MSSPKAAICSRLSPSAKERRIPRSRAVSGAPTSYWTRDWLSWSEESTAEQWPYRVKFYQTNVYGKTNNNTYPTGIKEINENETLRHENESQAIYDLSGRKVSNPKHGIYIIGGRKVVIK